MGLHPLSGRRAHRPDRQYRPEVHEEDDRSVLAKMPAPGFFRIWTQEKCLDAIFMTAFAIGRTDMTLYD